ncbi:MAG: hypothetical protein FWF08_03060 [Oscillospiraceae bacterium]|nr:hypothetical protein [Oscillospiraceae bacterium]
MDGMNFNSNFDFTSLTDFLNQLFEMLKEIFEKLRAIFNFGNNDPEGEEG